MDPFGTRLLDTGLVLLWRSEVETWINNPDSHDNRQPDIDIWTRVPSTTTWNLQRLDPGRVNAVRIFNRNYTFWSTIKKIFACGGPPSGRLLKRRAVSDGPLRGGLTAPKKHVIEGTHCCKKLKFKAKTWKTLQNEYIPPKNQYKVPKNAYMVLTGGAHVWTRQDTTLTMVTTHNTYTSTTHSPQHSNDTLQLFVDDVSADSESLKSHSEVTAVPGSAFQS